MMKCISIKKIEENQSILKIGSVTYLSDKTAHARSINAFCILMNQSLEAVWCKLLFEWVTDEDLNWNC